MSVTHELGVFGLWKKNVMVTCHHHLWRYLKLWCVSVPMAVGLIQPLDSDKPSRTLGLSRRAELSPLTLWNGGSHSLFSLVSPVTWNWGSHLFLWSHGETQPDHLVANELTCWKSWVQAWLKHTWVTYQSVKLNPRLDKWLCLKKILRIENSFRERTKITIWLSRVVVCHAL